MSRFDKFCSESRDNFVLLAQRWIVLESPSLVCVLEAFRQVKLGHPSNYLEQVSDRFLYEIILEKLKHVCWEYYKFRAICRDISSFPLDIYNLIFAEN